MSRYVDVDEILEKLDCLFKESNVKCLDFMRIGYNHAVADSIATVKGQPIVEVVRCKDCKYYNHQHHYCDGIGYWFGFEDEWSDNGFCYKGERREDEQIH